MTCTCWHAAPCNQHCWQRQEACILAAMY
jgi:hypothetical protein